MFFFFSSRRRHTRYWRDWSSDGVLFRSSKPADHAPSPSSLDHVGPLRTLLAADVELVFDVELAVLLDLHLGIAVHPPRRRSPDPPAVDVVDAAVARAEELPVPFGVDEPAHGAPQVGAGVGEDVDAVEELLTLLLGEPLALLVHKGGALAAPQLVAGGPLAAVLHDLVLPGEPDGILYREPLAGDPAFLLDAPGPVGLVYEIGRASW